MNNIKRDLVETGWGGVDCSGPAQHREEWRALVNAVMNLGIVENAGKLSSSRLHTVN
jgi:hypothetical protein